MEMLSPRVIARRFTADVAAPALGTTGLVVHTVPFAAFVFARWGGDPLAAITAVIRGGAARASGDGDIQPRVCAGA